MGKRKVGRPKQNFRSCIKEDLKCFNIWNNSSDLAQLSQITSNRETWRKLINKGAEQFQKEWERRRAEISMNENPLFTSESEGPCQNVTVCILYVPISNVDVWLK